MSVSQSLTQERIWETVVPMLKHQSEQLVQLIFGRYKMAYQLTKRQIIDQQRQPSPSSLSNAALEANYARIEKKEQNLTESFNNDSAKLEDLKEASSEQPRCQLIVNEARKSVREIQSYMVYHQPTLQAIQQGLKNLSDSSLQASVEINPETGVNQSARG